MFSRSGTLQLLIDNHSGYPGIRRQCALLGVCRSGLYYTPNVETEENLQIMRLLDSQYLKTPFYGARRLLSILRRECYAVNKKRLRRLMEAVR